MRLSTLLAAMAVAMPLPALAGEAWEDLRGLLYEGRAISAGDGVVRLEAPYRATDDREVPVGAAVAFADGRRIRSVTLLIDENPMPVSAVFELAEPQTAFSVLVNMRINGPSPVRAVVEDDAGGLYMAEAFVKTSGLGACAAPPVTDAVAARETLGQIALALPVGDASIGSRLAAIASGAPPSERARVELRHPSHSGLQMDQITMLYLPAHYVERVEVWEDGHSLFAMTGSISLSENPEIEFTHDAGTTELRVRVTDTEGGVFEERFGLGAI